MFNLCLIFSIGFRKTEDDEKSYKIEKLPKRFDIVNI